VKQEGRSFKVKENLEAEFKKSLVGMDRYFNFNYFIE
jgi:hypothetical protein